MTNSYDITREGWLPVVMNDGAFASVGLREFFEKAHEIRDIAAHNRVERLAILYLLTAINMRAFPDWEKTWQHGSFDANVINEYFDRYAHKFDLLSDTPFYQVKNLNEKTDGKRKEVPINNMCLVKHVTSQFLGVDQALPLKEVVPILITQFAYAQPGKIASTTISGKNSFAWTSSGFLAIGDSMFSTIMLNTVQPQWEGYSWEEDKAWWERDEGVDFSTTRIPNGVADYLTYQHRAIELVLNDDNEVSGFHIWEGEFWKPEGWEELMGIDPFSIYSKGKDGKYKRERFQSRTMTKNDKTLSYVTTGIVGGLFVLYTPDKDSRSLVYERVLSLTSHEERFVGYEVARLIVDASMGTLVETMVEEGLSVPYSLSSSPEMRDRAFRLIESTYGLHHKFEQSLKSLLPSGLLEESNAELSHYLNRRVRAYLAQGAQEDSDALLKEISEHMVHEFERWCERVPVNSWSQNYKKTLGFVKEANQYLKPKESATV